MRKKLRKFVQWLLHGEDREKETEFLPAILEVTETPPSPIGRLTMWTILVLVVVLLAWSFLGEINEVAVAGGKVIPSGQVKTVQVKNKGIVKEITVEEGQLVQEGDVLVVLDPTTTTADYDSLKKRAAYYKLDIQRLTAELTQQPFTPEEDPDLEPHDLAAEMALYQSRTSDYHTQRQSRLDVIDQKMARLQATQATYEKYAQVLAIQQEKEARLVELSEQNAISEFQLLEQQSATIEYAKNAQAELDELNSIKAEIAEAQQNLANVDASYHKDIMTALVEAKKEYYTVTESIKKADEDSRMATIYAPISGRVYNLNIHTLGGIVTDAQPLMQIVPEDAKLEFEVYADNKDIGFIKVGQEAEVKVETFNFQKFGMYKAEVMEISADAVNEPNDQQRDKKYKLLLDPTSNDINVYGQPAKIEIGMNVSAEIKIKEKRIIDFFLDPFRRYTSEALRER
ncbi:MAG: HlyD family type I secretion periplasmic adaptor subunit [Selenomonadaceae bacterium]|nr:HlyD family type I secretion periplasmic adaptor subunit [Selenomonadaceae bacterium]MBQ7722836.1 HlyD family type I secretion periplasmic adaptor subunit [Selenomonadaceae bacterium]